MTKPKDWINAEMRRRAEERLKERQHSLTSDSGETAQPEDLERLVHELQVHQIELEMQAEELQRARAEAEAGREHFTELYDFAPIGYFTLGPAGDIHQLNLQGASMLGLARSEIINRRFGMLVSETDRVVFSDFLREVFMGADERGCEVSLLHKGGSQLQVQIKGRTSSDPRKCFITVTDITERRRLEEEKLNLEIKVQQSHKLESIGTLAGGVAHDFNNMLASFFGYIEMARVYADQGMFQKIKPALGRAEASLERAKALTGRLLTFAKGGLPVKKRSDLGRLISETAEQALRGSEARMTLQISENLWPCLIDESQIRQVIDNIVRNADDAMPGGGVVSVKAENVRDRSELPKALSPGGHVRISVQDNGPGISKENLTRIFDPFFSTREARQGLGLAIAYSIVKKHDGVIEVDTAPGRGATFHVYLPACADTLESAGRSSTPSASTSRILLVDDDLSVLDVSRDMLSEAGYAVETATGGNEAIERYRQALEKSQPFDAVVLDLAIQPGPGGLHVMRELLKLDPYVTAIVCSGYADDPVMKDPQACGFKAAIAKPFRTSELREMLSKALSDRPGRTLAAGNQ